MYGYIVGTRAAKSSNSSELAAKIGLSMRGKLYQFAGLAIVGGMAHGLFSAPPTVLLETLNEHSLPWISRPKSRSVDLFFAHSIQKSCGV
jgi:hypothetical protein